MATWKRRTSGAVVNGGNHRNTHGGDQTEAKREKLLIPVPTWEKRFCFLVGGMPWKRFIEAKKYIHQSKKLMAWNDSAGENAFHDAKARFWADINGVRQKTQLPDPDTYIDKNIDWECEIDQEVLSEMEAAMAEAKARAEEKEEVIVVSLEEIKATGWVMESFDYRDLSGMIVGG